MCAHLFPRPTVKELKAYKHQLRRMDRIIKQNNTRSLTKHTDTFIATCRELFRKSLQPLKPDFLMSSRYCIINCGVDVLVLILCFFLLGVVKVR